MKIGVGDTNRNVVNNKIGIGGAWRTVKEIKMGVAGAWRSVWKRIAELIRTFTTKADFDTCTLTDTVATEAGDVELATGKKISSLPVGTKVRASNTKYNGAVIGFVVGHQASGRTKLVAERMITLKCFDAIEASNPDNDRKQYGNNRYSQSNIDQWLNSAAGAGAWYSARHSYDAPPNNANVYSNYNEYDAQPGFLSFFEESFRNAILDSTIRVAKNTVTDGGGYEDITRKVYLLSNTEVGLANENSVAEGTKWDLFSNDNSRKANPTAEAVSASEYTNAMLTTQYWWYWWLRTPYADSSYQARFVNDFGGLSLNDAYIGHTGVRPALELPNDIVVSETPDEDGYYTLDFSAGAYAQSGTAESSAIDLSPAGVAETSKIEFATTILDMGKALSFDGADDYVAIGSNTTSGALAVQGVTTMELWFYADNKNTGGIISQRNGTTHSRGIMIDTEALAFWSRDSSLSWKQVTCDFNTGCWNHAALVQDGSSLKGYLNGTLIGTLDMGSYKTGYYSYFTFGKNTNDSLYFDGTLDDVRIWNTARTQQQIQDNMNKELVGNESGLVGYWKLNEGTGTTANDSTSNNNDGTINGASWTDGAKTTLTMQTALSTDGGTTYGSWQTVTSGAAIPGLAAGDNVSNARMKWKATLGTNDASVTPKLHDVAVKLNEGM